jgi:predicted nucleic acid-binding protein
MKYVLDASVGLKIVMNETDTDKAFRVRDDFRNSVIELIAPDYYVIEAAHALTKAERRGFVTEPGILWDDLMLDCPDLFHSIPLMVRAIEISRQFRHAAYDCLYVALAEREGCELLTADQKLINKLQGALPFIKSLASLP